MNTAQNNDIHRQFDLSEISNDLGRNPDASSVLQVHLGRFVYAEHIEQDPGFALRLQVWRGAPQSEFVVPGIISFRMRAARTYALS